MFLSCFTLCTAAYTSPSQRRRAGAMGQAALRAAVLAGTAIGFSASSRRWSSMSSTAATLPSSKEAFDLFDFDDAGSTDSKEPKAAMRTLGFEKEERHLTSDVAADGSCTIEYVDYFKRTKHMILKRDPKGGFPE